MSRIKEFTSTQRVQRNVEKPKYNLRRYRNHYESEIGHFKGAITPDVDTFRDSRCYRGRLKSTQRR